MTTREPKTAVLYVDPQCPFAWITYCTLRQAERGDALDLDVRLMSLACVNEGEDLDADYRAYNEDAWPAARVCAALLASPDQARWPEFYEALGERRHVAGLRDNRANIKAAITDLGLPSTLADAADDETWNDDLRARTRQATQGVPAPGGTPITRIGEHAYFGPVLTEIPDMEAAVRLWHAVETLATTEGFASITTERSEALHPLIPN